MTDRLVPPAPVRDPWFPALADARVRLYLAGQSTSMLGSWTLDITLNLVLWELTKSPGLLGLLNFLLYGPGVLVTLATAHQLQPANARARTLWVVASTLVIALVLTGLSVAGALGVTAICVVAAVRGLLSGIELPARQLLMMNLMEHRTHLPSAVALNTVTFLVARMVGPALAATLFAAAGPSWGFGVAAAAVAVMLLCLQRLHPRPQGDDVAGATTRSAAGLRGAWRHVRDDRFGRLFVPVLTATALFSGGYQTLVPVLADRVFGDVHRYTGVFFATVGAGALIAAVLLSTRWLPLATQRLLTAMPWLVAAALAVVALSSDVLLTSAAFVVIGFGTAFVGTATNAILHRTVPEAARSGLIALLLLVFVGVIPLSQLLAGAVGQWMPVQLSFGVFAAALALTLLPLFWPRWWAARRLVWKLEDL